MTHPTKTAGIEDMTNGNTDDFSDLTPNQKRALSKGLAALETMAALWASEIRLAKMSKHIAEISDHVERAKRVQAMLELAFIEGAYRHYLDQPSVATDANYGGKGEAVAWKDEIIGYLQSSFDSEGITENDSGEELIRLSSAIAAVEEVAETAPQAEQLPQEDEGQCAPRANPDCALSWNGFNISGDEKSIREVRHLVNVAGRVKQLEDVLVEANHLRADADTAGASEPFEEAFQLVFDAYSKPRDKFGTDEQWALFIYHKIIKAITPMQKVRALLAAGASERADAEKDAALTDESLYSAAKEWGVNKSCDQQLAFIDGFEAARAILAARDGENG